jgi:hypothetical protein
MYVHGDQIGRIFAHLAILFFVKLLKDYKSRQNILGYFLPQ